MRGFSLKINVLNTAVTEQADTFSVRNDKFLRWSDTYILTAKYFPEIWNFIMKIYMNI